MVAVIGLIETVYKLGIRLRLVVGTRGYLLGEAFDGGLDFEYLVEGLGCLGHKCRGVGHTHLLREVAYRTLAIDGDSTLGGLLLASDDA